MPTTRIGAGQVADPDCRQRRELAAGTRTMLVDGAGDSLADGATQRHAARRLSRSAAHAHHVGRDLLGQSRRDAAAREIIGLAAVEGHLVGCAASAADNARTAGYHAGV